MYLYWIKKQKRFCADIGEYTSFGIGVWDVGAGGKPLLLIPDVSTDGRAALALAIRCTVHRLQPCHLTDVIADFLP